MMQQYTRSPVTLWNPGEKFGNKKTSVTHELCLLFENEERVKSKKFKEMNVPKPNIIPYALSVVMSKEQAKKSDPPKV